MFKVRVEGLEEAKRKLSGLDSAVEPMARAALRDGAEVFQRAAQLKVVGGPTGSMGKAIQIKDGVL